MKQFFMLLSFTLAITYAVQGQKLTFSAEIQHSEERAIREIAQVWQNYLLSPDNKASYWLHDNGDIFSQMIGKRPIYLFGSHFTFNIRKLTANVYEINTINTWGTDSTSYNIPFIYKVCAVEEKGDYKLANYFSQHKSSLKTFNAQHIDYYYAHSFRFDSLDAKRAEHFVADFLQSYDIELSNPICYIAANTLDECNSMLGLSYSIFRSELPYAGFTIFPNIVLSCQTAHLHELVHAMMNSAYPFAPTLLHEGIANYYTGSGQISYADQLPLLRDYIKRNPSIDLSDFHSYNHLLNDNFNPFYTVGALLIEHALSLGGESKVKELFAYSTEQDCFEQAFYTSKDKIHAFLYDLIHKSDRK